MRTKKLLFKAKRNGCSFVASCVGISQYEWNKFMEGATRANRIDAVKIALMANVIDEDEASRELKNPYYNPYKHLKTKTHLIYVHSGIEHFIEIN